MPSSTILEETLSTAANNIIDTTFKKSIKVFSAQTRTTKKVVVSVYIYLLYTKVIKDSHKK